MIDVTGRADIDVRLVPLELLLGHLFPFRLRCTARNALALCNVSSTARWKRCCAPPSRGKLSPDSSTRIQAYRLLLLGRYAVNAPSRAPQPRNIIRQNSPMSTARFSPSS